MAQMPQRRSIAPSTAAHANGHSTCSSASATSKERESTESVQGPLDLMQVEPVDMQSTCSISSRWHC